MTWDSSWTSCLTSEMLRPQVCCCSTGNSKGQFTPVFQKGLEGL